MESNLVTDISYYDFDLPEELIAQTPEKKRDHSRLLVLNKDDQTIGLLLCKEADRFVAETTLMNNSSKLGISKYKFIEELPEYLNKRLISGDNK